MPNNSTDKRNAPREALRELHENAQEQLDRAQKALYDDNVSDEDALAHLDKALDYVKAMLPDSSEKDLTKVA